MKYGHKLMDHNISEFGYSVFQKFTYLIVRLYSFLVSFYFFMQFSWFVLHLLFDFKKPFLLLFFYICICMCVFLFLF